MRPARPLFIDGRKLPGDPSPVWQGYSVGRWEGDTPVIETAGFNKRTITITDPQTFTKPITFSVVEEYRSLGALLRRKRTGRRTHAGENGKQ
jgi:hypothetical protein